MKLPMVYVKVSLSLPLTVVFKVEKVLAVNQSHSLAQP